MGAQDLYWEKEGALQDKYPWDVKGLWVPVCYHWPFGKAACFGETDAQWAKKVRCTDEGLKPILCVGEL